MIVGFEGRRAPAWLLEAVAGGRCGGVIVFARNLGVQFETAAMVAELAGASPPEAPPLIVSIDQEGGRVQRLRSPLTVWPPMARVGARRDPALTEAVGRAIGEELRLLGFNVDYAPVCDVATNPANPVIGDRAFGTGADVVEEQSAAFLRGLEGAGVRGCAKHFPGHGDTAQDSHFELPRVDHPMARLRAVELPPFAALVRAGVGMVMTAHVVVSALDSVPATMSRAWIDGVLRGELGFRGVVVSDDLDMAAVAGSFPLAQVVFEALDAGVDAFLACRDRARQQATEAALLRAAAAPRLAGRVEAALARMRTFRASLAPAWPAGANELARALPDREHEALAGSL